MEKCFNFIAHLTPSQVISWVQNFVHFNSQYSFCSGGSLSLRKSGLTQIPYIDYFINWWKNIQVCPDLYSSRDHGKHIMWKHMNWRHFSRLDGKNGGNISEWIFFNGKLVYSDFSWLFKLK